MASRPFAVCALLGFICFGQASVWDGIYSDAQAGRGAPAYREACASCHGEKLDGRSQAPPLAGNDFMFSWDGKSVGDLLERIEVSMPADRPGQLSKEQNAAILAYILNFNNFPAGSKDLSVDSALLQKVRFESNKSSK